MNKLAAVAALAASTLLAAGLAGCTNTDGRETITFSTYGTDAEIAIKQELIDKFEAANPDIKIDMTYTTGTQYPTKLETYFSSTTAPDVVSIGADNFLSFSDRDLFEDLSDSADLSLWDEELVSAFRAGEDDTLYALPWTWKSLAIAYNKDLFAQAGIAEPTSDWTEDDLVAAARAISDLGGDVYGFDANWYLLWGIRNTYGEPNYDVTAGEMTAAENSSYAHGLGLFSSLIDDGVSPAPSGGGGLAASFQSGLIGMQVIGAWDPAAYQEQIGDRFAWDVVGMPSDSDYGAWTTPLFDDGLAISANSANKDAALEFIRYLTTDEEAQRIAGDLGYPALSSLTEEYLQTFPDGATPYNRGAFQESPRVGWQSTGIWAQINDEESSLFDQVVNGSLDVDAMVTQLQKRGTELLAE